MITDINQLDPNGYYTYQDYLTWRFKERVELLLGRIFKMSPAPGRRHQEVSGALHGELYMQFKGQKRCSLFSAPFDVRLPVSKTEDKTDTVVQPDLCVVCDADKLDKQGCNGAPDLVIEILSPGNTPKEMKDKFELYEASKVTEYWIVDPEREDVLVYTLNEKNKYIGSKPFVSEEQVVSRLFPDLELAADVVFGR
jgi:Uma2 family endonuclease